MGSLIKKVGAPPGTLVYTGERKVDKVKITISDWNEEELSTIVTEDPADCLRFKDSENVTWINVEGLHEVEFLNQLGTDFGVHPLVLEDILNTGQRAKVEDYGDYLYIVMKHMEIDEETMEVTDEQVSILLGRKNVITFFEAPSKVFDPIISRLSRPTSRIRKLGTDYLAYALMDTLIDNYLLILKIIEDRAVGLEEELTGDLDDGTLQGINLLRRQMIHIRRAIAPLRDVMNEFSNGDSPLMTEETEIYIKDLRDHWMLAMELTESERDVLSHLLDVYLSLVSNKMNDIMKVLTIIATIFIPLTFVAGIYGMNYQYMPELESQYGYPLILGAMLSLALLMVLFFRRKGWL